MALFDAFAPFAPYVTPVVTGAIGAAGGVYATRSKSVADDRDDDREDDKINDERWQAMLDNQRKDFDLLLNPMRTELAELRPEVRELRSEVREVRSVLEKIRGLFHSAIDHIRVLRARWPTEAAPLPVLPHDLTDEV